MADLHLDVEVVGDLTVDWRVAIKPRPSRRLPQHDGQWDISYRWNVPELAGMGPEAGGPDILTKLIDNVFAENGQGATRLNVGGPDLNSEVVNNPQHASLTRIYTVLQKLQQGPPPDDEKYAWRVHRRFGQIVASQTDASPLHVPSDKASTCLVIDDSNYSEPGFTYRSSSKLWPTWLRDASQQPGHIILKTQHPLAEGELWEVLRDNYASILTVYTSAVDLRRADLPISQPLSWERTSSDILTAIRDHLELKCAARVIVSLGLGGAVIVEGGQHGLLIFDPRHQEDDWERRHPGVATMWGTCITAALATRCAQEPGKPDWSRAVKVGLQAGRALHKNGFQLAKGGGVPRFPVTEVVEALRSGPTSGTWSEAEIPPPKRSEQWTLLSGRYAADLQAAARRIVREGPEFACKKVPLEKVGRWVSVDRTEIESIRGIRNIIGEYLEYDISEKPRSLAVFGPAGAGKSFAIEQMADEWAKSGQRIEMQSFNLSGWTSVAPLVDAFQQIRDAHLRNVLPLVFWDEFDTVREGKTLGWLAQFLAPMQDGTFWDGYAIRPIGRAIFVFAGSTCQTMEHFKKRSEDDELNREAKVKDFISRLRGFVNVLGPNRTDTDDKAFVLRRALLLRALLRKHAREIFASTDDNAELRIDGGILSAFLQTERFVYGARSMEAIIEMSSLAGRDEFERASLPELHQLELHVDAKDFLQLVEEHHVASTDRRRANVWPGAGLPAWLRRLLKGSV